ncbi:hypothetical protein S83_004154, partial [Arachis hypogaea]
EIPTEAEHRWLRFHGIMENSLQKGKSRSASKSEKENQILHHLVLSRYNCKRVSYPRLDKETCSVVLRLCCLRKTGNYDFIEQESFLM